MTEYERIKQEISKLQEQLKKIEKNEIKRPDGELKYFIFEEECGEKECKNEEVWINKLFKLSSNKTLFVTYYESFNKEKKDFEVFEKTWFSPKEKDNEDFLRAVYSADDFRKLSSIQIGVENRRKELICEAWIIIPQFQEFTKKVKEASIKKDSSFFDEMDKWTLKYK